ncbi:probable lipoprotein YPO2292 [Geofilum rubicundum JCM 15548]|uniref:Probable lipoprotein YPO2292 n=2 Tax=Geofilum TaxID=1236988 RepID=A0A0E9M012_9BACT|nr:probable lipoprotein YPO2292 [Geofilum rubicundum JCM 15548]
MIVVSCQGRASSNEENVEGPTLQQGQFVATASDSLFYDEVMKEVLTPMDTAVALNERIIATAKAFVGTPYVAATLEREGAEELVVNLRNVDCTTFVEYVLAMVQVSLDGGTDFGRMAYELQRLRYRDGVVKGYPSRLHYFTDWLKNNERRGFLTLISDSIGNASMDMGLDFMSAHPGFYPQLEKNPALVEKIRLHEEDLANTEMAYITKDSIQDREHLIVDGDIIAFVTTIEGLDVSHTGFACFQGERLYLLHASTRTNLVEISPVPLSQYLQNMATVSGILVARPHF